MDKEERQALIKAIENAQAECENLKAANAILRLEVNKLKGELEEKREYLIQN